MESISLSQLRVQLNKVIHNITYKGARFVLTKNGKQVAAFIPIENLELLEELENSADLKAAKKAL